MIFCDKLESHPRIGAGSHHDSDQDEKLTEDLLKQIEKKFYLH